MKPLADDYLVLKRSPDPDNYYVYSPSIVTLPGGRLIATYDVRDKRPERKKEGIYGEFSDSSMHGYIHISDDGGRTWRMTGEFPFIHARPFEAGGTVYILGHAGDLMIMKSEDNGQTWGQPVRWTEGESWHQAPCNVLYHNGCIYLVMEWIDKSVGYRGWPVCVIAPVMLRAKVNDDLMKMENWTFSDKKRFIDLVDRDRINYIGIPFYHNEYLKSVEMKKGVWFNEVGWLETHVVKIYDTDHYMHADNALHMLSRANTGITNMAVLSKVVENADGTMTVTHETAPSGRQISFVPLPGGQMKFHILYDDKTQLYWLLSSQSTDSAVRIEKLPLERFSLPDNERNRLVLHFSKNCVDWCFAGVVAIGASPKQSRHYASMTIHGEDLLVLSRSGDEHAKSAHDGNIITLHRVMKFRDLIY